MRHRVLLFSGMGGDARLLSRLSLPDAEVKAIDHLEPRDGEGLREYAGRVAESAGVRESDVLGGASFGGMLAAEIARQRRVRGLVLLGSCLRPGRLPWSYRWIERLGRFIPDAALAVRSWSPLVRYRFSLRYRFKPLDKAAEDCLVAMAADCPPRQIREFGRMILGWDGLEKAPCPLLSIHGDRDRVIPLACAEPGVVLRDAGHALTLTHADETMRELQAFLEKLSSDFSREKSADNPA